MDPASSTLASRIRDLLPDLEGVYAHIHAHPELSMQETRTAGVAADCLRAAGFGSFGAQWHVPSVFWFVGATDPEVYAKAKQFGTDQ
jgi:hypothetical protein